MANVPTSFIGGIPYKNQFANINFQNLSVLARESSKNGEVVVHQQLERVIADVAAIVPGLTETQVRNLISNEVVGLFEIRASGIDASAADVATAIGESPLPGYAYVIGTAGSVFGVSAAAGDIVYYTSSGTWGLFDNVDPTVSCDANDPVLVVEKVGANEYRVTSKQAFVERVAALETRATNLESSVSDLTDRVAQEEATRAQQFGNLSDADAALGGRISTVETTLGTAIAAIDAVEDSIEVIETALSAKIEAAKLKEFGAAMLTATKKLLTLGAPESTTQNVPGGVITTFWAEGFGPKYDFEASKIRTASAPFELFADVQEEMVSASSVPADIRGNSTSVWLQVTFLADQPVTGLRVALDRYPDEGDAFTIADSVFSGLSTASLSTEFGTVRFINTFGVVGWTLPGQAEVPYSNMIEMFISDGVLYGKSASGETWFSTIESVSWSRFTGSNGAYQSMKNAAGLVLYAADAVN